MQCMHRILIFIFSNHDISECMKLLDISNLTNIHHERFLLDIRMILQSFMYAHNVICQHDSCKKHCLVSCSGEITTKISTPKLDTHAKDRLNYSQSQQN